jgi:seryl-tRNA synthetase
MVKTRSQNRKDSATRNIIITEGVVTRSQKYQNQNQNQIQDQHAPVQKALKKKMLPKVELTDRIKHQITKREQLRKQIRQNQTSILNEIHMDANTSKTQNNQEMTSVWKNFESIFKYIDDFMRFKKRVEDKSIYII